MARRGRRGSVSAQAASPSRTVIPVSPFRPKAKPVGVLRIVQHRDQVIAELAGRQRRAEPGQVRLALDAHRARVGVGAGVADPGPADDLQRHDCLEADPELLLLRDAIGVFGHEPEHALGAGIAARQRRSVHGRAARVRPGRGFLA